MDSSHREKKINNNNKRKRESRKIVKPGEGKKENTA